MAYAILRIEKHKSLSSLAAADRHGKNRSRLKKLSFPERSEENKIYQMHPNLTLVQSWKKETENIKIRKNAVYALEVIQTFSPEIRYDIEDREDEWVQENYRWLQENFPNCPILQFRVEYDESNLHIHSFILPRTKDNKLCAKQFIGDKFKLSELQSSYAVSMAKFNLERGKCYLDNPNIPKPRHATLKEYYARLENEQNKSKEVIIDLHKRLEEIE